MARFIYGTNDISASTFPSWSNAIDEGAGNISQSIAFDDFHPSQGPADFGIQILQGASVFYGNVIPGNGGTCQVDAPYSVAATTSTITVKNLDISATSITLHARANYPHTFDSWRTATAGGGSSIASTNTVTLTDASIADHVNYYAHFTTTHADTSSVVYPGFSGSALAGNSTDACTGSTDTIYYYNGDADDSQPVTGDTIASNDSLASTVAAGFIKLTSNNFVQTNASGVVIATGSCS